MYHDDSLIIIGDYLVMFPVLTIRGRQELGPRWFSA